MSQGRAKRCLKVHAYSGTNKLSNYRSDVYLVSFKGSGVQPIRSIYSNSALRVVSCNE